MADIEKMYFQIFVAEEHRCLLRLLLWKNGNILDEPIVYKMRVHVLGGVSSGDCSNYALKRTAIENEHIYGNGAAEILKNNFLCRKLTEVCTI